MRYLLLNLFIFLAILSAQTQSSETNHTRIIKILDCNLFLSSRGDTLQLAGVQVPDLPDDSLKSQTLKSEILEYNRKIFIERSPAIKIIDSTFSKKFILAWYKQKCINLEYLRRGFAKFRPLPALKDSASFKEAESFARSHANGIWAAYSSRIQPLKFYRYFRMAGGLLLVPPDFIGESRYKFFPSISVGYHYGDLLGFSLTRQDRITLTAQAYTFWAFLLPILQIGPEYYHKETRFGMYWGRWFPMILGLIAPVERANSQFFSFEMGKRKVNTQGKWYEFILTLYWFPDRESGKFLFKVEMNLPPL